MSRLYAIDDGGERFLRRITCDEPRCRAAIEPHATIATSGWTKWGCRTDEDRGSWVEWDYCPDHEPKRVLDPD